jgi:hypothetical protein
MALFESFASLVIGSSNGAANAAALGPTGDGRWMKKRQKRRKWRLTRWG